MKTKTIIKSEPTTSFLVFSVGEHRFAIDALNVRRIAKWVAPVQMPGASQTNMDVVDIENETSVIFRLEDLLPNPPRKFDFLVLAFHPKTNIAFAATNVYELASVPTSAILDTPRVMENPDYYRMFSKSYMDDKGIVVVFDVGQLKL